MGAFELRIEVPRAGAAHIEFEPKEMEVVMSPFSSALLLSALLLPTPSQESTSPTQGAPPLFSKTGESRDGEISDESPLVHTPTLDKGYSDAPIRGESYRFELPAGPVTIELRSWFFDSYLVARDGTGAIVAEDDDGLLGTHAQIVVAASVARTLSIDACALHGGTGAFHLTLRPGRPDPIPAAQREKLEIDDARQGLQVVEAARGPMHVDTMTCLHRLAWLLWKQKRFAEARPLFERALSICEQTLGADDPRTISCVGNLAIQLLELGDYKAAQPLFERQLVRLDATLGPDHDTTIWVLRNLAFVTTELGDYAKARPLYERALNSSKRADGGISPYAAQDLNNMGTFLEKQGKLAEARKYLEQALAVFTQYLGPDHQVTVTAENNLATVTMKLGDVVEARRLCERALHDREAKFGPDDAATAASVMTLATILNDSGNCSEAIPLLERAMKTLETSKGADHPDVGRCAHELATTLLHAGEESRALSLYRRSLGIFESRLAADHPDTANAVASVSMILEHQGQWAEAERLNRREIDIWERIAGPDGAPTASAKNRLALLCMNQGRYTEAQDLFERAHAIAAKSRDRSDESSICYSCNLALNLCNLQRTEAALPLLSEALESLRAVAIRTLLVASDWERCAWLHENAWQLEALLSARTLHRSDDSSAATYDLVRFWKRLGSRMAVQTHGRLISHFDAETRTKLSDLHSIQAALSTAVFHYDLQHREANELQLSRLREREGELEREIAKIGSGEVDDPHESLETLRSVLPKGSVLVDFFIHRVYLFASANGADEKVQGHWSAPRVSAWIVRPESPSPTWIDLGDAAALEAGVQGFLASFVPSRRTPTPGVESSSRPDFESENRKLLARLWSPLESRIGGATRLFIVPDRFLSLLPFEALQAEDGRFLLEKLAISYLPEAGALLRLGTADPRTDRFVGDVLLAGGIDFDHRGDFLPGRSPIETHPVAEATGERTRGFDGRWAPLRETRREVDSIESTIRAGSRGANVKIIRLQGDAACEEALKQSLAGKRVIHLATHGFFEAKGLRSWWQDLPEPGRDELQLPEELHRVTGLMPGLLSGLVCAGTNLEPAKDRDDGYLTAAEITWQDLSQCELVVLSACDTGLGAERGGEGMASMQSAFALAGARTVIASLWQIEDASTAGLMKSFYERLWIKGQSRLEALRDARLELLRNNRLRQPGQARPETWGAFTLTGDPQ